MGSLTVGSSWRGLVVMVGTLFILIPCWYFSGITYAKSSSLSLQPQQGMYFRWSMPADWRVSETNAGVTLTSPDGRCCAFLAGIMRSRGSRTPIDFLRYMLSLSGCTNVRIISTKELPPKRMSYQVWQSLEVTCSYTSRGLPVKAVITSAVANYSGMNDAVFTGYQAANADFQEAQSFLPQIAKSIVLTNATQAFGNDSLIHPKNRPMDDTVVKTWEHNQQIRDKTMRESDNARRGTIDLYDPSTGQTLNTWDRHEKYYWRKSGTNEVVGTKTYNPPDLGYVPLQSPPPQGR